MSSDVVYPGSSLAFPGSPIYTPGGLFLPAYPVPAAVGFPGVTWTIAPKFWYSAQNADALGNGNAAIADAQLMTAIKNLGTFGAGADIAGAGAARVAFRKIAQAGKINNLSAFEATGAQFMQSAAFALSAQPLTWCFVFKRAGSPASEVIGAGGATNTNQTYFGINQLLASGGTGFSSALNTVAGVWETEVVTFSGAASAFNLNGTDDPGNPKNGGALGIDRLTLFNNPGSTGPFTGMLAECAVWQGAAPTAAAINSSVAAVYGATPQ